MIQDHVNGNLLFAGTEFGLFTSVDGGASWVQLKGGMPTIQVRDMAVQKRENDLVLGTFGRGFYVLDDYSPLREITPQRWPRRRGCFRCATRICSRQSAWRPPARPASARWRGTGRRRTRRSAPCSPTTSSSRSPLTRSSC